MPYKGRIAKLMLWWNYQASHDWLPWKRFPYFISNPLGLLLMRVRDELKMTIAAYQTLYQSSVTFGMRKQLQSE
jgi:hypothetical protein